MQGCRSTGRFARLMALAALVAWGCGKSKTTDPGGDVEGEHLLAFASDRGALTSPTVFLYDIDLFGFRALPGLDLGGSETLPSLSVDGQLLAFTETGTGGSDVFVYDRNARGTQSRPRLATAANESCPRFAGNGVRLAFVSDVSGAKRVQLYDPVGDTLVALPGLASASGDDDEPSPDQTGDRIAFTSTHAAGKSDVLVWDRATGLLAAPDLASDSLDVEPSLTPDGHFLAFASRRAGGLGGWDVYLYDTSAGALVPLPGLNSSDDERFPAISRDGARIVFESNRVNINGGQMDLYLYTRTDSSVLVLPGLPSPGNDVQPYLRWR